MTKSSTPIIGQLAVIMGWIMDAIFNFFNQFGIQNIAVCIVVFTIIMALLMLPMTISQQKFMKINALMQPEMRAIQDKYRGKSDNASMSRQNAEIQALYDKYGTSPTGSCLPLIIQMPVIFALYQVILNVPAYVSGIKAEFMNIVTPLMQQNDYINKIAELASSKNLSIEKYDYTQADRLVDLLYKFTNTEWESLKEIFPSISNTISTNVETINRMNSMGPVNLAETPWQNLLSVAILIPILAGLFQWLMTKSMEKANGQSQQEGMEQMKMMNNLMPLMSVFFCFTLPAAVGIYWVASSGARYLCQIFVNKYMDTVDVNDMIKENIEKKNRKRERKGLPPINERAMMQKVDQARRIQEKNKEQEDVNMEKRNAMEAQSTEYYKSRSSNPGSISSRARMVQDFNERNMKRK